MNKRNLIIILLLLGFLLIISLVVIVLLILNKTRSFTYPENIIELTDNVAINSDNNLIVLISMDGMGLNLIGEDTPFLNSIINDEGTTYSENAKTIIQSETLPSHVSMVTGLSLDHHGFRDNFLTPLTPPLQWQTIFDIALEQGYDYRAFVTKSKLSYLLGTKQDERLKVVEEDSSEVIADIDSFVEPESSDLLVFIHFRDPDRVGHQSGWDSAEQAEAIAIMDDNIKTMIRDMEIEFQGYNRKYILTADHGGEGYAHSSGCPLCRAIPLIINAGDEEELYPLPHDEYNIYDVACIVISMMGGQIPAEMDCKP